MGEGGHVWQKLRGFFAPGWPAEKSQKFLRRRHAEMRIVSESHTRGRRNHAALQWAPRCNAGDGEVKLLAWHHRGAHGGVATPDSPLSPRGCLSILLDVLGGKLYLGDNRCQQQDADSSVSNIRPFRNPDRLLSRFAGALAPPGFTRSLLRIQIQSLVYSVNNSTETQAINSHQTSILSVSLPLILLFFLPLLSKRESTRL